MRSCGPEKSRRRLELLIAVRPGTGSFRSGPGGGLLAAHAVAVTVQVRAVARLADVNRCRSGGAGGRTVRERRRRNGRRCGGDGGRRYGSGSYRSGSYRSRSGRSPLLLLFLLLPRGFLLGQALTLRLFRLTLSFSLFGRLPVGFLAGSDQRLGLVLVHPDQGTVVVFGADVYRSPGCRRRSRCSSRRR